MIASTFFDNQTVYVQQLFTVVHKLIRGGTAGSVSAMYAALPPTRLWSMTRKRRSVMEYTWCCNPVCAMHSAPAVLFCGDPKSDRKCQAAGLQRIPACRLTKLPLCHSRSPPILFKTQSSSAVLFQHKGRNGNT